MHPISKMNDKQQELLCHDAMEYASKNDILLRKYQIKMQMNAFRITLPARETKEGVQEGVHVGLKCSCVPTVVLDFTLKLDKIFIVVRQNQFVNKNIVFVNEIIESIHPRGKLNFDAQK